MLNLLFELLRDWLIDLSERLGFKRPPMEKTKKLILSSSWMLMFMNKAGYRAYFFRNALFYLGVNRDDLLGGQRPIAAKKFMGDQQIPAVCYRILLEVLEKAESEGRVLWKEPGKGKSMKELSDFLVKHGYPPVSKELQDGPYNPLKVTEHLVNTNLNAFY